ncbi:MAG: glycosyltransferase family 2 protein [Carboxylicivirga sp.]|jgi:glycosyltransferase involved in cell wall biosynthesis|nr:glycosyltransferase family 2 protein [Carboxylicivirga sp.]
MKKITVFTPSFNRAHLLPRLYMSLLKQSNNDFEWLIIDDGSVDNTADVVKEWITDGKISIKYHYQDNQGMHGAHNTAYHLIKTDLNVCVDSDDYMPETAIEKILSFWNKYGNDNFAGIVGLDALEDGTILGNKLPDKKSTKLSYYYASGGQGDKKVVYRTEVVKKYPDYGIYAGERLVPLGSKYTLIDQDYELLVLNEVLCIVDYQEDGSSGTILRQYKQSPRGFAEARLVNMKYGVRFIDRFRAAIHYVSSAIFSGDSSFLRKSNKKGLTVGAIPLGILLNLYIRFKIRRG